MESLSQTSRMSEESPSPSSLEDFSSYLVKSEYDKVIFHDVAESYSTDADVECKYTLTSGITPTHGDRVALFKVGWMAPHQYLKYEWAPVPEEGQSLSNEGQVLFETKDLPKDDGEFYQFCYISSEGTVRGASIPFRFRRPSIEDLVEVEDDDSDLLIIRSRTAVIEEKMREVAFKNIELMKSKVIINKELEEERKKNAEKFIKLRDTEIEVEKLEKVLEEESQKHQKEIEKLKKELDELTVKTEHELKQMQIQQLQAESFIRELQTTIKQQKEEVLTHHKDRETLLMQLSNSENRLKLTSLKVDELSKELSFQQDASQRLQQQKELLESTLREEQQKNKDLRTLNIELEEGRLRAVNQLLDTEHMLAAMEKSKFLATEEIMAHAEFKDKVTRDLENTRCDVHNLKCQLKVLDEEYKRKLQENKKIQEELLHLENKYSSLNVSHEELLNKQKLWEQEEKLLKNSVEDLSQRLKTGATEYHSKYIESLKLEKKVNKLKKKIQEKTLTVTKTKAGGKDERMDEQIPDSTAENEDRVPIQETAVLSYKAKLAERDEIINNLKEEMKCLKASGMVQAQQQIPVGACATSASSSSVLYPNPPYYPYPYAVYGCTVPTNPFLFEHKHSTETTTASSKSPVANEDILDKPAANDPCTGLPPPIMPEVTSKAKLVAIAAVNRQLIPPNSDELPNCIISTSANNQGSSTDDDEELIPKVCPVCDLTFLGSDVDRLYQDHLEAHYGFDCPVCNAHYNPDQTAQLELHVQTHFANNSSVFKYQVNID